MGKKIVSRSELSRLAGVSAAAVTKVCDTLLKDATVGRRIDAAHPAAVQYIQSQTDKRRDEPEPAAPGLDPLYEQAVEWVRTTGRASTTGIREGLKVGYARAQKIMAQLESAGIAKKTTHAGPSGQSTPPPKPKTGRAAANEAKKAEPPVELDAVPDNVEEFADLTLREIIAKFGTQYRFNDYLQSMQKIEQIREKQLKNSQTEGTLVSRDRVQVGVIDVFNNANLRLMADGSKSIAAGVAAKCKAGAELPEIEAYVADIVGQFIRPVKDKVAKALGDA